MGGLVLGVNILYIFLLSLGNTHGVERVNCYVMGVTIIVFFKFFSTFGFKLSNGILVFCAGHTTQNCKTVRKKVGNTVTTTTTCS